MIDLEQIGYFLYMEQCEKDNCQEKNTGGKDANENAEADALQIPLPLLQRTQRQ